MKKLFLALILISAARLFAQVSDRHISAQLTSTCSNANTTCDVAGVTNFQLSTGDVLGPQTIEINTQGYGLAQITAHGAYTGSVVNFEFSNDGGSNWYPQLCTRSDTNVQEQNETVASNANVPWECGVGASTKFRVRQSAISTGGPVIDITITAGIIEPAPTAVVLGSAANNVAPIGAPLQTGLVSGATGTNPTAVTAGNMAQAQSDITGNLYVRTGGPNQITCYARGVAAALTDFTQVAGGAGCGSQTAAGLKLYITDITVASTTATAGAFRLSFGTGAACVTTNNAIFPGNTSDTWFYPGNTANPLQLTFNQPLVTSAAQRLCVFGTATNTANISVNGFIAP